MVMAVRHVMPSILTDGNAWHIPPVEPITKDDSLTLALVVEIKRRLAASGENPLTTGMVLRVPNYVSSRNTAAVTSPLGQLMAQIEPNFVPHFNWAQAHKKHHWWQIFIRIFIEVIDKVVGAIGRAVYGPAAGALMEAVTDAELQGIFCAVHLLDKFSWEEVEGAAFDGALGGMSFNLGEQLAITIAQEITTQEIQLVTHQRKHFDIRGLFIAAAGTLISAGTGVVMGPPAKNAVGRAAQAVFSNAIQSAVTEVVGAAIMGRPPSLENMADNFGMSMGAYIGGAIGKELKCTQEKEKAQAKTLGKQTGTHRPAGSLPTDYDHADQESRGVVVAYATGDVEVRSGGHLINLKHATDVQQADPFNVPDWVTNAVDAKYAFSMFNKSEQASIFGSDVQNYMDLATRSTTPIVPYAQYTRTHPTSQQPKAVAEPWYDRAWDGVKSYLLKTAAGTASTMQLYGNAQSIAMGHVILDPLGSDLATSMANGAVEAADYFKSANPAVMALDFALGKDIYTGLPVNRSQVLTALALDVFGGEMFSVAGKGLAMLFTPGVDAGIAASTLMGAKLYLGSALESGLSGAIFGSLDSALVQPIKGMMGKVELFRGGAEGAPEVGQKLRLSDQARKLYRAGKIREALDVHYEDLVRARTGGVSQIINGREIDAVTDQALIEVKRSKAALDNPTSFIKSTRRQIKATIASASELNKNAEFWFKYGVDSQVRNYIELRGGVVRAGLPDATQGLAHDFTPYNPNYLGR